MFKEKRIALAVLAALAANVAYSASKVDFRPTNYLSLGSNSGDAFVGYQDTFAGMVAGNNNMKLFVGRNLPMVSQYYPGDKFSDLFFLRNDGVVFRPNQYPLSGGSDEVSRIGMLPSPSTVSWIWNQRLDISGINPLQDWWAYDQTQKVIYKNGQAQFTGITNLFALPVSPMGPMDYEGRNTWAPLFFNADSGKVYTYYNSNGISVPSGALNASSKLIALPSSSGSTPGQPNIYFQDGDGQLWYLVGDAAQSSATKLGHATDLFVYGTSERVNFIVYKDLLGNVHHVRAGGKTINDGYPRNYGGQVIMSAWPDKILASTVSGTKAGMFYTRGNETFYFGTVPNSGATNVTLSEVKVADFAAVDVAFPERHLHEFVLLSPGGDVYQVNKGAASQSAIPTTKVMSGVDKLIKYAKTPKKWFTSGTINAGATNLTENFGQNEHFAALKMVSGDYKTLAGADATVAANEALARPEGQDGYIKKVQGGFGVNLWGADSFAYTSQTTADSDLIAVDSGLVFDIHADGTVLASRATAPWIAQVFDFGYGPIIGGKQNFAGYMLGNSLPYDSSKQAQTTGFSEFLPLMPPNNVKASDAAYKEKVVVTWAADRTTIYDILRKEAIGGGSFAVIGTTAPGAASYDDSTVVAGKSYIYAVVAKRPAIGSGQYLTSDSTAQDAGRAGIAPTAVGGTVNVEANATKAVANPRVTSADATDTYTFAVGSNAPSHGTATTDATGNLVYTPAQNFYGADVFDVTATSAAGYQVSGQMTVNVQCTAPKINSVTAPTGYQPEYVETNVAVSFDSNLCNSTLDVIAEVLDSQGAPITGMAQNNSAGSGTGGALNFKFKDLPAGSYTARVTVKSPTSGNSTVSSTTIRFARLAVPAMNVDKTSLTEDTPVSVTLPPANGGCTPTSDTAVAMADPSKCLVTWTDVPEGMKANGIAMAGTPFQGLNQHIGAKFSVYDSKGVEHVIGQRDNFINVYPPAPPMIGMDKYPAGGSWAEHLDYVSSNLAVTSGFACQLYTNSSAAAAAAAAGVSGGTGKIPKICYLDVKHVPAGLRLDTSVSGVVGVRGRLHSSADNKLQMDVYKVTHGSDNYMLVQGMQVTLPAKDMPVVAKLTMSMPSLARGAQTEKVIVENPRDAISCAYTSDTETAKTSYQNNGVLNCLVEWATVPAGLAVDNTSTAPVLNGVPSGTGIQNVVANVSAVAEDGTKFPLGNVSGTFNAVEPTPPTMSILPGKGVSLVNYKGDQLYLVPRTGAVGQMKILASPLGKVQTSVTENGVLTAGTPGVIPGASVNMAIKPSYPSWEIQSVDVSGKVEGIAGNIVATDTNKMALLPPASMNVKIASSLLNLSKTDASTIQLQVFDAASKDSCCDQKQGEWMVFIADAANPTLNGKLIEPVATAADGTATVSVPPSVMMGKRLVAVAVPKTDIPNAIKLVSPTSSATFVTTDAINSKIINRSLGGPLPYSVNMTIAADDPTLALNIGKVTWYVKGPKDSGFVEIQGQTTSALRYQASQPGTYTFKADVANKWSGKVFSTEMSEVKTYDKLVALIDGPSLVLAGSSVTLKADSKTSSGARPPATYRWTVYEPGKDSVVYSGVDQIQISSQTAASFRVTLDAKSLDADGQVKASWASLTKMIQFGAAPKPRMSYTGQRSCEVGMPCSLKVAVTPGWDKTATTTLKIRGQWLLPDGSTVDIADPIWTPDRATQADPTNGIVEYVWKPTEDDFKRTAPTVALKAWVEGDDSASYTGSQRLYVNKYVWPEMTVNTMSGSVAYAPAYARLAVVPLKAADNAYLVGKRLTYKWFFPDGVAGSANGNTATVNINMVGSYEVKAEVTDGRSTSNLTYKIDILNPKPYVMTLSLMPALQYNRAPMNFMVRPSYYGGHPQDKPANWNLTVDGNSLYSGVTQPLQVTGLAAGDHDVTLTMKSLMGAEVSASAKVTVNENVAATCDGISATWDAAKKSVYVKSSCIDKDGRIKGYAWYLNGQKQTTTNNPTYITIPAELTSAELRLDVVDDSGAATSYTTSVDR